MKATEKYITLTEFKKNGLKILDQLRDQAVVITKRGRPIARVTPITPSGIERFYGCMKGKIKIKGDIFSTGVKWDTES